MIGVVLMYWDYYAFGMLMPNRFEGISEDGTRHLFNGMEHDGEVSGSGNSYTTEFRQYDPRLGRWKSRDPLEASFPWQSPYVAFDNNPIYYTDPLGLAAEGGEGDPPAGLPENPDNNQAAEADNGNKYTFDEKSGKWIYTTPDVEVEGRAKKPTGYYLPNTDLDVEKFRGDGFDPNPFYKKVPEKPPYSEYDIHVTDRRKTDNASTDENNDDHFDADDSSTDPNERWGEVHYSDETPGGPGTKGYGDNGGTEYPPKVNLDINPGQWEMSETVWFFEYQYPWNTLDNRSTFIIRRWGDSNDTVIETNDNPDNMKVLYNGEYRDYLDVINEWYPNE